MSANINTINNRRWRAKNPERNAELAARYRGKNRENIAAKQRARAAKNIEHEKARVTKWYADTQEKKAGRARPDLCEVCDGPPTKGRRLNFDHCHDQGHFRGWICGRCNLALGLVRDDPALLKKLADYLHDDMLAQPFVELERNRCQP